jgi:hypothetical protein
MSGPHRVSSLFPTHLRRVVFVLFCAALLLGCVFAQDRPAFVNAGAVKAAAVRAAVAAIGINGTSTVGTLPVFADSSGDLTNSVVGQQTLATGAMGITINVPPGYTAPAALTIPDLDLVGANPTLRIDSYSNASGASPNFNFISGHGTAGSPGAIGDGDNLGQFAANGWNGSAFPSSSKVKVAFVSVGAWTPTANGTGMSFQTTSSTDTTTARTSRLYIDDTGNVGIGSIYGGTFNGGTPPPHPLTVNGIIDSASGGIMFPDSTTQTTGVPSCTADQLPRWNGTTGWACFTSLAATSVVTEAAPNAGILATLSSNQLALGIDPTVVQDRVSGVPCPAGEAISSISQTGAATCVSVGGNSVTFPVLWSDDFTTPAVGEQGVLNVTNTATGAAVPPSGTFFTDFAAVPAGVYGEATGADVTAGVIGYASGTDGVGVVGWAPNSADAGVVGIGPTSGVYGFLQSPSTSTSSPSYMLTGATSATTAPDCSGVETTCGVYGVGVNLASITSGTPVGFGALFDSASAVGIELDFEKELSGTTLTGTVGNMIEMTTNGGSPYFLVEGNGDVNISGTLTKGGGSFKIDHPLDPANKYLYHSFVESPDMMNIYNGVIVLDKRGKAVVQLPDYFEALNQDFRYQLTAIGAPGPNLYVAGEIKGNKFVIAGGKPGAKVSWQVTGIRHDAYAEAHRIKVEEDKGDKRGTYIHPELFQKDPVLAKK